MFASGSGVRVCSALCRPLAANCSIAKPKVQRCADVSAYDIKVPREIRFRVALAYSNLSSYIDVKLVTPISVKPNLSQTNANVFLLKATTNP